MQTICTFLRQSSQTDYLLTFVWFRYSRIECQSLSNRLGIVEWRKRSLEIAARRRARNFPAASSLSPVGSYRGCRHKIKIDWFHNLCKSTQRKRVEETFVIAVIVHSARSLIDDWLFGWIGERSLCCGIALRKHSNSVANEIRYSSPGVEPLQFRSAKLWRYRFMGRESFQLISKRLFSHSPAPSRSLNRSLLATEAKDPADLEPRLFRALRVYCSPIVNEKSFSCSSHKGQMLSCSHTRSTSKVAMRAFFMERIDSYWVIEWCLCLLRPPKVRLRQLHLNDLTRSSCSFNGKRAYADEIYS